ncbi:hypothetical protein [Pseudomonas kurunegalensis]|uniref:hypothetical protein n=1 Tax=Pseudomonas kurunegalensis TaxID=485880 RepID=UPI00236467FF|nr:hypothetical protein [Pseudomonas kurunegalensis]MDD2133370.1 hypothetical protein [Pseudomonas kurunegalensis]
MEGVSPTRRSFLTVLGAGAGAAACAVVASRVVATSEPGTDEEARAGLSYVVDNDGRVHLDWVDGKDRRGFVFGKAGANELPNFYQTTLNGHPLSTYTTDWIPPIVFEALLDGGGRAGLAFTGGNHLVDGKRSAENISFEIEADGYSIKPGDEGHADRVTCRVINKLMASNTVSKGRYALLQSVQVDFAAGCANVHADVVALEDLSVFIDYGPQMVTTGVNEKVFYLGGMNETPAKFNGNLNSGNFKEAPKAWASLCSSRKGQLAAWIDRGYGIADGTHIHESFGMIIGGGPGSVKQYTTAIHRQLKRDKSNYLTLSKGDRYQWRGGYSWSSGRSKPGFVASMKYLDNGRVRQADALSGAIYLNP